MSRVGREISPSRHQQHVGGAGEHEAAGHAPAIDRRLERCEQRRHSLHFVQDRPLGQVGDEAGRVGLRAAAGDVVVEAEVLVTQPLADEAGQRRLAALSRAVDQNSRRVAQQGRSQER
jgi:hypothetical protein